MAREIRLEHSRIEDVVVLVLVVVVVKIREKFGDGTRKLPIQELAYSYA